jgi:hypothetical protein
MRLSLGISLFLGIAITSGAQANSVDVIVNDFIDVCVSSVPEIGVSQEKSSKRGFVILAVGDIPELDEYIWREGSVYSAVKALPDKDKFLFLSVGKTRLIADEVMFCVMQTINSDPNTIATSLASALRLTEPDVDVMNSGQRMRMWPTYIHGRKEMIILNNLTQNQIDYGARITITAPTNPTERQ